MPIQLKEKGENNTMKQKKVIAILTLVLMLSLMGCDSNNDEAETQVKENNSTAENVENNLDEDGALQEDETLNEESEMTSNGFSTEYTIENAKDGYFIVSKLDGALYGLLDSYGNEVIPLEYDSIVFPESKEAEAVIVEVEGNKGILDYDGNEVLAVEYEEVINSGINSTRYLVQKDGAQSIVDLEGTTFKDLTGQYTSLVGNSFLVQGKEPITDLYSLDEKEIFSGDYTEADGSYAYELDYVNDYIGICHFTQSMNLLGADGENILSYPYANNDGGEGYGMMSDQGSDNLISIQYFPDGLSATASHYKLINIEKKSISESSYTQIAGNEECIFALSADYETGSNTIDIYDKEGQIIQTLEFEAESVEVHLDNPLITVRNGETYRIYDKEGKEISEERYLSVEPFSDCLMLQNLDGEYGLMGSSGDMLIEFGNMEEESYNGLKWKDTYSFDDTFCIVTESSSGSNVWLFSN